MRIDLLLSIITFIICFLACYFSVGFFLRKNKMKNLKKMNDKGERWASQSKPIFGGLIFYLAFCFASVLTFFVSKVSVIHFIGIFVSVSMAFLMGFMDDRKNTHPMAKFVVQILVAVVLIITDLHVNISENPIINYALTIFWVVSLMNSLNMLDNMDAITASVSTTTTIGMIILALINNNFTSEYIILLSAVLASLLAFLFWNWNPSKLYMGDNGSQFLGAFLAIMGIIFLWRPTSLDSDPYNLKEVIIVILAFIVPISDTATVTINRLLAGKSPFVGDKNHVTHNLSYLGLSERQVAVLLIFISLCGLSVAIYILTCQCVFSFEKILIIGSAVFITFLSLYSTTRIPKKVK